jgi:hypothetical protein
VPEVWGDISSSSLNKLIIEYSGQVITTVISYNLADSNSEFTENKNLYADYSLIVDSDGVNIPAWQWQRSTDGGSTWLDISGATADSYTLSGDDVGYLVRVTGIYIDGQGFNNSVSSSASTVIQPAVSGMFIAGNSDLATASITGDTGASGDPVSGSELQRLTPETQPVSDADTVLALAKMPVMAMPANDDLDQLLAFDASPAGDGVSESFANSWIPSIFLADFAYPESFDLYSLKTSLASLDEIRASDIL